MPFYRGVWPMGHGTRESESGAERWNRGLGSLYGPDLSARHLDRVVASCTTNCIAPLVEIMQRRSWRARCLGASVELFLAQRKPEWKGE